MDGTAPKWFRYGLWRFFIRYAAPVSVGATVRSEIVEVSAAKATSR